MTQGQRGACPARGYANGRAERPESPGIGRSNQSEPEVPDTRMGMPRFRPQSTRTNEAGTD